MPHVAVVFEFPTLNGGERSMLVALKALKQDSRFRFSAIAPKHGDLADSLAALDISIRPFQVRREDCKQPAAALHEQLEHIIRDAKPDLLHGNSLSMSRLIGQLTISRDSDLQRTGHLRDIMKLKARVIADLNANDGLIAVSEATRRFHVSQGLNAEHCHVIQNGVDTIVFAPRDSIATRKQLLPQIPATAKILLNVGQICLRKDQLLLARCVCCMLQERDDLHLVIVGKRHSEKAESIAFEEAITEEFRQAGKRQHLHLMGCRGDVNRLMNAADLLVHTARQEPLGRTLLEAAASGLPIIATKVGGTPEILRHGVDAWLVPANAEAELIKAVTSLVDNDDQRQRLVASARGRIQTEFNVQRSAQRLAEFWLLHTESAVEN